MPWSKNWKRLANATSASTRNKAHHPFTYIRLSMFALFPRAHNVAYLDIHEHVMIY